MYFLDMTDYRLTFYKRHISQDLAVEGQNAPFLITVVLPFLKWQRHRCQFVWGGEIVSEEKIYCLCESPNTVFSPCWLHSVRDNDFCWVQLFRFSQCPVSELVINTSEICKTVHWVGGSRSSVGGSWQKLWSMCMSTLVSWPMRSRQRPHPCKWLLFALSWQQLQQLCQGD